MGGADMSLCPQRTQIIPPNSGSGSFPMKTHQGGQKETVFLDHLRRDDLFSLLVPLLVFFCQGHFKK